MHERAKSRGNEIMRQSNIKEEEEGKRLKMRELREFKKEESKYGKKRTREN